MFSLLPTGRLTGVRSGFTLVELLIVISIIAILVTLTVPGIQSTLASARNAKCISNLRMVAAACNLFRAENGHFPQGNYDAVNNNKGWQDQLASAGFLDLTNNKAKVINCPEFAKVPNPPATMLGQTPQIVFSYWINPTQFQASQNAVDTSQARSTTGRSCVLIMDGAGVNAGMNLYGFTNSVFPSTDLVRMTFRHGGRLTGDALSSWSSSKPYPGKMNMAFADGHVEAASVPVGTPFDASSIFAQSERW
jgi:prepilin-type N-terminal cleavage/methylation domain-containing protein/prepilin-type processing-associated H-X9-DG protein